MEGGGPGALGRNTWIKQIREEDGDVREDGQAHPRKINIGGKATIFVGKGDRLLIETPGGGSWGASEGERATDGSPHVRAWEARGSLAERAATQAGF
jgi:5-oxoprolinase (ATP-hydrolysing)